MVARCLQGVRDAHPQLRGRRVLFETIRQLLSQQVYDVIGATRVALEKHRPADADAARRCPSLLQFSPPMAHESVALKAFLRTALYRHPQVVETTERAKQVIRDLFAAYADGPPAWPAERTPGRPRPRDIADYIAGMTDRYALREHHRLTGRRLFGSDGFGL